MIGKRIDIGSTLEFLTKSRDYITFSIGQVVIGLILPVYFYLF